MTLAENLKGLWGISLCAWGIYCLIIILCIKRFIVNRYEKESNLGQTMFFTDHMPFTKGLLGFFSSSLYCGHLLSFVWGWRIIKIINEKRPNITYFNDIDNPELVTKHFS